MIPWWQLVLSVLVGVAIGWLSGLPYKKTDASRTSKLIINLILGAAGGLLGVFLHWVMQTLLLTQLIGVLIMAAIGAIILLWLLARVKSSGATDAKKE